VLDGIRVLDFGRYVAGPYCASLLADFGADVIRIEQPEGGEDRYVTPLTPDGDGALYLALNRNKRSMTLSLSSKEGREVLRRLVSGSDVVIANMPQDALRAAGLDYEALSSLRRDIICATMSAFGDRGPWRSRLGFDSVGQSMSGAVFLSGEPGRPYRAQVNWVDYSTALFAAFGVMLALFERARSGRGQQVSGSLMASALALNNAALMEEAVAQTRRQPIGNRSPNSAPTDLFRAKDGWLAVQVVGRRVFERWARLMGDAAHWLGDARFADDMSRANHGAALSARMAEWVAERTQEEALEQLAAARIPAGPVLSPQEVLKHPQAAEAFSPIDYPGLPRPAPVMLSPVELSLTPPRLNVRPPTLGEHTESVLATLGYDAGEIAGLKLRRVI
jgi:crotonobetainyl-CoA:carnitine CoA-transferase CaiB-like acyl-CoA transferase